ncbi:hypothetical protein ABGT92_08665 [Streptomyces cinereoruber]|uniref:hypothetical protein n=1 Tax=Streptomyces cinereoruber TaxID=67260 RepID=UPI00345CF3AC
MSKTSVSNATSSMLCLWVEPWGTDHWMRPGEEFTVVTETEAEESPFNVVVHGQGRAMPNTCGSALTEGGVPSRWIDR